MRIGSILKGVVLALSVTASAWGAQGTDGGPQGRTPPAEAIAACADQSEGARVQWTSPGGDVVYATCTTRGSQLVAVPDGPPPTTNNGDQGSAPPADPPR